MPEISSEKFLRMVAKSGLVESSKVDEMEEKIRAKCQGELPKDSRVVAKAFKRKGLITDWHIEKLLGGKYKGFFLGKYKLLGHIGTGGMSSVYLAEHTRLHDRRAIKVLPKARVKDATYLARFQQEAKAIASLNHPNIVLAYDIDNEGDVHYIVMEYVDGLDLQAIVKRDGPLDPSTAADWIAQAARGLSHAHSKGVIHRDVKPANLLIDQDGVIRLLDMGLALVTAGDEESMTVANNENVLGTADYLAPEQALNSHTVDHRADIYGLGCTLYYLLTGKPPFSDGTLAQRIAKHQTEMPPSIRKVRPDVPGEIEGICVKMIQKEAAYRYQSADDVAEVLEKFAALVPKGQRVTTGLGASPDFDDEDDASAISLDDASGRSIGQGDTISNKNADTLASSRSKVIRGKGLSASDSGRLVNVKTRGAELIDGSFLDLEVESGFPKDKSTGPPRDRPQRKTPPLTSGHSSVHVGAESDVHRSSTGTGASKAGSRKGIDPMLVIALLVTFFIVAASIGFYVARVMP